MSFRRAFAIVALASLVSVAVSSPARAQDAISKETAAAVKTSFIADLDTLHKKFVGLAEAFPQDKYTWRPMDGVRSVSEVLMLAAMEGYAFIPTSFGGKPSPDMGSRESLTKLTDKAQIIDHLNKAFAYSKKTLESADPSTLTGKRKVMGMDMTTVDVALGIGGDLHEHLGQMIAYARTNHIVPPWSK